MSRDRFGFRELGKALLGAAAGTATFVVTGFPRAVRHLPGAVAAVSKRIWKENRIGRNIKILAFITLPFATVLVIPLTFVGSVLYGFIAGAWRTVGHGVGFAVGKLAADGAEVDQKLDEDLLPGIGDFEPKPLPEGKKPFDIRLITLSYTVPNGLATAFVGAAMMTVVYLVRLPLLYGRLTRAVFKETTPGFFLLSVLIWVLLDAATIASLALMPVGSALFSLGVGSVKTYSKGVPAAWSGVFSNVKSLNGTLAEFKSA